jgi:hypothetical protein
MQQEGPGQSSTEAPDERAWARERAELLANVHRLEAELQRYREHAQRTSKLFLSASNFADWVRESARRDAEAALRKARARAERYRVAEEECERAEVRLAHLQEELRRTQALADEARSRLSAFLASALHALSDSPQAGPSSPDGSPVHDEDLPSTLHERLETASTPPPAWVAGSERPDH